MNSYYDRRVLFFALHSSQDDFTLATLNLNVLAGIVEALPVMAMLMLEELGVLITCILGEPQGSKFQEPELAI